jgi:hypothetical protein
MYRRAYKCILYLMEWTVCALSEGKSTITIILLTIFFSSMSRANSYVYQLLPLGSYQTCDFSFQCRSRPIRMVFFQLTSKQIFCLIYYSIADFVAVKRPLWTRCVHRTEIKCVLATNYWISVLNALRKQHKW